MTRVVSQIAHCIDCGKTWEDWNTARIKGYQHAKKSNHTVMVETVTALIYNPRKFKEEKK